MKKYKVPSKTSTKIDRHYLIHRKQGRWWTEGQWGAATALEGGGEEEVRARCTE